MRGAKATSSFSVSAITAFILILSSANVSLYAQVKSNPDSLAKVYNNTGVDFAIAGDYEQASTFFLKSLRIRESLPNYPKFKLANGYINLANLKMELSYLDSALFYYNKSEQLLLDVQTEITAIQNLGVLHIQKGSCLTYMQNYADAILYIRKGISILQRDSINNNSKIIQSYQKLSGTYLLSGNKLEALQSVRRGYELAQKSNYPLQGNLASALATCLHVNNRFSEAIKYFLVAEQLLLKLKSNRAEELIGLYTNLALSYWKENEFEKAKLCFLKANNCIQPKIPFNRVVGYFLKNFAGFAYKNGDIEKSDSLFSLCISLNIKKAEVPNHNAEEALQYYFPSLAAQCFVGLGDVYRSKSLAQKNNQYAKLAMDAYRQSLEIVDALKNNIDDESDKLWLDDNYHTIYLKAIQQSILIADESSDNIDFAIRTSSKAKASVLHQAIAKEKGVASTGVPADLLKKEQQLRLTANRLLELLHEEKAKEQVSPKHLQNLEDRLFNTQREWKELLGTIERSYPKYFSLKYDNSSVSIAQLQQKISKKQVVIDYILIDSLLLSFAITKGGVEWRSEKIDTVFFTQLAAFIEELNPTSFEQLSKYNLNRYANAAFYLYQKLVEPYSTLISGKEIIVVPHKQLASVPFCALITEKPNNPRGYYSLAYLVKSTPISYFPSTKLFYTSTHRRPLLYVNAISFAPEYAEGFNSFEFSTLLNRQNYSDLPGAEKESKEISKIFNGLQVMGKDVSEQYFKEHVFKYDVLHLAMHTYIDEGNPLFSKLVFATSPDTIDDGLLNTYEIYGIRLKCRLAIISACRSGDGRLLQGEGILSLARGFQYAGCPSLIAAQWRIDDFSGADVIASFAKNIKKGMSVSNALQLAQTGFIANADPLRSHPYFWASYQLIGNNAPIYYSTQVVVMFWVLLLLLLAPAGYFLTRRIRNRNLKRIE